MKNQKDKGKGSIEREYLMITSQETLKKMRTDDYYMSLF